MPNIYLIIGAVIALGLIGWQIDSMGYDRCEANYNADALDQVNVEQEAARDVTQKNQQGKSQIIKSERKAREKIQSNSKINDHIVSDYFDAGSDELWRRYNENNQ